MSAGDIMNILHMKYVAEVAKQGSLNKAAEVLLIAQPNLSRSVKELESELGITIFTRSAKGMVLTPEGEEFIGYANRLIRYTRRVYQRSRGFPYLFPEPAIYQMPLHSFQRA